MPLAYRDAKGPGRNGERTSVEIMREIAEMESEGSCSPSGEAVDL